MNRTAAHAPPRPLFCPRCDREGPAEASLCPECGDRLAGQGYCPICRDRWRLLAGAPCPKHDLPLEADPPPAEASDRAEQVADWVTVGAYARPGEAEARRLRLEAEGIPTFLDGQRMGLNSMYAGATGGIKLQVPRELTAEARVLLAQTWGPLPDVDDPDDAWDDLAPGPDAGEDATSAAWQVAALPLAILLALCVYLVVRRF